MLSAASVVAALIDVAELDRRADPEFALVGLFLAHEHPQQRRLAGAVGADDADDAAGRQAEVDVLEDHAIAVRFAEVRGLDRPVSPSRGPGGIWISSSSGRSSNCSAAIFS